MNILKSVCVRSICEKRKCKSYICPWQASLLVNFGSLSGIQKRLSKIKRTNISIGKKMWPSSFQVGTTKWYFFQQDSTAPRSAKDWLNFQSQNNLALVSKRYRLVLFYFWFWSEMDAIFLKRKIFFSPK